MKQFLFLISSVMLLHISYAQPGTLDPSFANSGKLIDTFNSYIESTPIAVQQDGKIIVGSYANLENTTILHVTRYLTDGTIDTSFGSKGSAYGPIYNGYQVTILALQPDGKIVAVDGFAGDIARFNTDGTLDSSFGNNGLTQIKSSNGYELYTMLVQPDGRIVFGGSEIITDEFGQSVSQTFIIFRIMPDGLPDESFGKEGRLVSQNGTAVKSLALQPDGKIIAGGYNFDRHFYIERYLSEGIIDKGFGEGGSIETTFEAINKPCILSTIALQKDGKIVATGANDELIPSLLLARYNSNGKLDKTFNDSGKVVAQFPVAGVQGVSVLIMSNNKIVVAGNNVDQHSGGNSDFALTCYNDDGSLDQTFGDKGFTFTDMGGSDIVSSAALQSDGKIVIAGISYYKTAPSFTISIARYNGFDANKQPLMVRIKRWLQHHGISWQALQSNTVKYYTIQRSTDGITYTNIAKVSGSTSTFEDATTSITNRYYRIAATGWDGSRTYSNTVLVDDAQQAKIFPNPVRDNLQLQNLPLTGNTSLSVVDLNGNVRSTATATGSSYSVNTAALGSGSYLLKIQHNGTATTLPFVKE